MAQACAEMPRYRSHKTVRALKIKTVTPMGEDSTVDENSIVMIEFENHRFAAKRCNLCGKTAPEAGWYYVVYENEYWSFSPANAFEEEYALESELAEAADWRFCMVSVNTIGWAIQQMHNGAKVRRAGWNGKGLWLELQVPDEHSKMTLPYLYINYPADAVNTPGARVPWAASQSDLLATDWEIAV